MGIPFYYCVGNHDCEKSNWQAIKNFAEIRKPYYSFVMDGIKFIVLNTCFMVHGQKVMLYQKDIIGCSVSVECYQNKLVISKD